MRQKARPLRILYLYVALLPTAIATGAKGQRILKENSLTFSEVDACLAPGAGLKRMWGRRQRLELLEENTISTAIRMRGRTREGDSLEEKMIRSACWSFRFSERTSPPPSELNYLCVGIFWSNFKAGVRAQLECDKRKRSPKLLSQTPLNLATLV